MFSILVSSWQHHQHWLLLLAAAIWVSGSLSLFMLLQRSLEFGALRQRQWHAVGATTGGIGVWATHFLAMLAHRDCMGVSYQVSLTLLSTLEVIAFFWFALRAFVSKSGWLGQAFAGVLATAGVMLMHFTGMAAAQTGTAPRYELLPVIAAIAASAFCFGAAFLTFGRTRGWLQVAAPALLAVLAVFILHFVVMSATTLLPTGATGIPQSGLDRSWLATAIVAATVLLVLATTVAMLLDRYLTDLRGFADATLDGIAIVHDGHIVEVNRRFTELLGQDRAALLGRSPLQWLTATDGHPLLVERDCPGEARLISTGLFDRDLEIASHRIEYRGRDCLVLALRDLTEKKEAQRRIEHMARHDVLTDLPNRALLGERLDHALARARREGQHVALIALDLDRFKAVNDVFGHAAGDAVLCKVARILRSATRDTDTVARIGGDEFVILQVGATQPQGARALTSRIFESFGREMDVARDPLAVGVSMGVAVFSNDAADAESLRHGADVALYRAKEAGRGTAHFFDRDMHEAVRERRALEHDLRHALPRGELDLAFQPLVRTSDGQVSGYEALLRWDHPERGEVSPETFIPIAEDTGAIVPLGEWALRRACGAAAQWNDQLFLAVNVSPVQFQMPDLAETIEAILRETGLAPGRLELEITETALMKDRAKVLSTLERLKQIGVRIVMDDFGTGYSSLSNLQSFPFDKIKIDRSFVSLMEQDTAARSIVRAMVGIGRSLALTVVAEGVETEAQWRMVVEEGCAQAQGYLFGRPERATTTQVRAAA